MDKIIINGSKPLNGIVEVSGMKNAAVAVIFATILVGDKCVLENLPNISDVTCALEILKNMGMSVRYLTDDTVEIDSSNVRCGSSDENLVSKMRASYYIIGAELGRFGRSYVALPGGCDFGVRPIDQHIRGFEALGADVVVDDNFVTCNTESGRTIGGDIFFDVNTVGGTINVILAAARAKGNTVIENAAKEPHVVDVCNFLNNCGAKISGAGTDTIKIKGVDNLHGCSYTIIPDMIEAGTYMIAVAAAGGKLQINNIIPKHLESLSSKLEEMGVSITEDDDFVIVSSDKDQLKRVNIKTLPYPGFPTDLQPQICPLLCLAHGTSFLNESVWENRFKYVDELLKMGANIKINGRTAIIQGPTKFRGAEVYARDLRAGASMIIAGLCAEGTTEIGNIHFIERGYDNIVGKLSQVGADIRVESFPD